MNAIYDVLFSVEIVCMTVAGLAVLVCVAFIVRRRWRAAHRHVDALVLVGRTGDGGRRDLKG